MLSKCRLESLSYIISDLSLEQILFVKQIKKLIHSTYVKSKLKRHNYQKNLISAFIRLDLQH